MVIGDRKQRERSMATPASLVSVQLCTCGPPRKLPPSREGSAAPCREDRRSSRSTSTSPRTSSRTCAGGCGRTRLPSPAPERLGAGHRAGLPPGARRLLARRVRLAGAGGAPQRASTQFHDDDRRAAHPLPPRPLARARRAAAAHQSTAGPARSSSSSTCIGPLTDPRRTAAIPPTPSTSSRRRCPATRSPARPTSPGWHPRRIAEAFVELMADARLRPLRRAGRRLGLDRDAERRRPRSRARRRPAPQLRHRAPEPALSATRRPHRRGAGAASSAMQRVRRTHRRRLPGDPGHEAADARLRARGLARRAGGVDRREVPRVERLRRRRRARRSRKDQLLTNITSYWVTATATSSARLYYEMRQAGRGALPQAYVGVPTGIANFPGEVTRTPRSWVEHRYNVMHWTEHAPGRPLRGDGGARPVRRRRARVLPDRQVGRAPPLTPRQVH